MIDKKASQWGNSDMANYLRQSTLFGEKFESYLNERVQIEEEKSVNRAEYPCHVCKYPDSGEPIWHRYIEIPQGTCKGEVLINEVGQV